MAAQASTNMVDSVFVPPSGRGHFGKVAGWFYVHTLRDHAHDFCVDVYRTPSGYAAIPLTKWVMTPPSVSPDQMALALVPMVA